MYDIVKFTNIFFWHYRFLLNFFITNRKLIQLAFYLNWIIIAYIWLLTYSYYYFGYGISWKDRFYFPNKYQDVLTYITVLLWHQTLLLWIPSLDTGARFNFCMKGLDMLRTVHLDNHSKVLCPKLKVYRAFL